MGYLPLPYNKDRNKVFYKEMDNGLIVCAGIVSSSLYQDRRKTVSFYAALSYTWAMYSPILLPQDCYLRIGEILGENNLWFQRSCRAVRGAEGLCFRRRYGLLHRGFLRGCAQRRHCAEGRPFGPDRLPGRRG